MKHLANKIIFVFILLINSFLGFAQEVNLASFFLIQNNQEVILNWTIDKGATCNGISIFKSNDSISYNEIGSIGGICGSSSSAISYTFTDKNPTLNQTNYYKIRLGYSQFSEVKNIYLKYTPLGKLIIKPNPSSDKVLIDFNNEEVNKYELTLTNSSGNIVYVQNDIWGDSIELNTASYNSGVYFITLIAPNGRLLREKLIIQK